MAESFDVVVVGAGLMGSSAAYHVAKADPTKRVLLLEQFPLGHAFGSSHGETRIFRVAYPDLTYATMCVDSLTQWRELQELSGETLLTMTGAIDFAPQREPLIAVVDVLTQLQQPYEELSGEQVNARFPGFALPASSHAVYTPHAAVLNPSKAMHVLQQLAQTHGVEVRDQTAVKSLAHVEDGRVRLELASGSCIVATKCIVTAGPWTTKLVSLASGGVAIPIRAVATCGTYWTPTHAALYTPDQFPVFIDYGESGMYGLPMMDPQVGVKVCSHLGPEVDPDKRQQLTAPRPQEIDAIQRFIQTHLSGVDASAGVRKADLCMYSNTEDEHFILDTIPAPGAPAHAPHSVVLGAGFSGHGAKFTPVIGQILAQLTLAGGTPYAITTFALERLVQKAPVVVE